MGRCLRQTPPQKSDFGESHRVPVWKSHRACGRRAPGGGGRRAVAPTQTPLVSTHPPKIAIPLLEIPKVGFLGRCLPKAAPHDRSPSLEPPFWTPKPPFWTPQMPKMSIFVKFLKMDTTPRSPGLENHPPRGPKGPLGAPWGPKGPKGPKGPLGALLGGAREGSLHWFSLRPA